MSVIGCEFTDTAGAVPEESFARSQDLWADYARSGPGSAIENNLVETHLPLVKTVVRRLALTLPSHVNIADMFSAGLVGLLNAVRRFDSTCGASFETYARLRIRGAVFDELRRLDWVPRSVHDKAKRVEKAMQEVGQRTGRVPSGLEMARALKLSPSEYEELLEEIRPSTYLCLDTLRTGDFEQGAPAHDFVSDSSQASPEASAERREINDLIGRRMGQLPENQRKVLALYYFEDLRLREIATAFGVTESRICQIHAQAILSLKALLRRYDPEIFNEPALLDTYS